MAGVSSELAKTLGQMTVARVIDNFKFCRRVNEDKSWEGPGEWLGIMARGQGRQRAQGSRSTDRARDDWIND